MSELGQIHEKLNETSLAVANIDGKITATFPHLATKEDLSKGISTHVKDEHSKPVTRWDLALKPLLLALAGLIGAAGGYFFSVS